MLVKLKIHIHDIFDGSLAEGRRRGAPGGGLGAALEGRVAAGYLNLTLPLAKLWIYPHLPLPIPMS